MGLARLISHVLFDGWLRCHAGSYIVGFANKNYVLIEQFKTDVKRLVDAHFYERRRENDVYEVELSSKFLWKFLNDFTSNLDLLAKFLEEDEKKITEFLRAFWDDEGTISIDLKKRSIKLRGRQKDEKVRNFLLELHREIGIPAREDYDRLGIIISRRDNLKKFFEKIGFSHGVKIGRGKGNLRYGKEKLQVLREILNQKL